MQMLTDLANLTCNTSLQSEFLYERDLQKKGMARIKVDAESITSSRQDSRL